MAVDVGSAVGYLDLDITGFLSGLKSAQSEADSASKNIVTKWGTKISSAGKSLSSVGSTLTKYVTTPIVGVGVAGLKVATDFEKGMSEVRAISGATGNELNALKETAIDLGASTAFSANEVAGAMTEMAKAGWDSQQIIDGMGGVLDAAAASGENLGTVATIVADAITGFGLEAKESTKVADLLTQAANSGTIGINDLGESFKYIAPVAGAMGLSVEDVTTALSAMSMAGIKGSQAGTSLRTMLTRMVKPTDAVAKAMDELGISVTEQDGSMKSLDEIVSTLRTSFDGLTESEKAKYAATLAGQEGMAGMLSLLNLTEEEYNELAASMDNATGVAQKTAEVMQDNLQSKVEQLGGSLESLAIKLADIVMPHLEKFVTWLTNLVDKFAELDPKTQETILKFAGFAAVIGPIALTIGKLTTGVGKVVTAFGNLASKGKPAKAVLEEVGNAGGNSSGKIKTAAASFGNLAGQALKLVAAGASLLMVGAGIKLIADSAVSVAQAGPGAAAAFVLLTAGAIGLTAAIVAIGGAATATAGGLLAIGAAVALVSAGIALIIVAVTGLVETIAQNCEQIKVLIETVASSIVNIITALFDSITNYITNVITSLGNAISNIITSVGDAISNIVTSVGNAVSNIVTSVGNAISNVVTSVGNAISNVATSVGNAVSNVATSVGNAVSNVVTSAGNAISNVVTSVGNAISNVMTSVGNAISTVVTSVGNAIAEVNNSFANLVSAIGDAISGVLNSFAQVIESIGKAALDAGNGFKILADAIINLVNNTSLADLVLTLGSVANGIKDINKAAKDSDKAAKSITNFAKTVKKDVDSVVSNINNAAKAISDFVSSTISNINSVASSFSSNFSSIQKTISEFNKSVTNMSKNVTTSMNTVKSSVQSGTSSVKTNVNSMVSTIQTGTNNVKTSMSSMATAVQTGTNNVKTSMQGCATGVRTSMSSITSAIQTGTVGVKTGMSSMELAISSSTKNAINSMETFKTNFTSKISSVKSSISDLERAFKNAKLSFNQHIALPHFYMSGSFDAKTGRVPTVGVSWYKKAMLNGMILNGATIFGFDPRTGQFLGGGEAGSETVVGTKSLLQMIRKSVSEAIKPMLSATYELARASNELGYVTYNGFTKQSQVLEKVVESRNDNSGGDTFIFHSPKPINEVEAAKQMKRAKRDMAEGF